MKILAFVAHPDDETMLTGGALALLARAGAEVHYLCATRGEGGEVGEPPLCVQDQLGEIREAEMRCAVAVLGGKSVSFLDYVDPLIGENDALYPYTRDLAELTERVIGHIQRLEIEAIITHGSSGEYGHPAHVLTHRAAVETVRLLGNEAPLLYTFNANFPGHPKPRHLNENDPADIVLDIMPVFEQKVKAAYCHVSQNALFVRRSSEREGRQVTVPEVLVKVEGLHRVHPIQLEVDPILGMLQPWSLESKLVG